MIAKSEDKFNFDLNNLTKWDIMFDGQDAGHFFESRDNPAKIGMYDNRINYVRAPVYDFNAKAIYQPFNENYVLFLLNSFCLTGTQKHFQFSI